VRSDTSKFEAVPWKYSLARSQISLEKYWKIPAESGCPYLLQRENLVL